MKKIIPLILLGLLFGCTQTPEKNGTKLTELEESFEFNIVNADIAKNRSHDFISDVYKRHPKAKFEIKYQPNASEFVDTLVAHMKRTGIAPDRINPVIQDGAEKQISIISRYIYVQAKNCGTMYFSKSRDYAYGCVIEFNHTLMLASPEKLKR